MTRLRFWSAARCDVLQLTCYSTTSRKECLKQRNAWNSCGTRSLDILFKTFISTSQLIELGAVFCIPTSTRLRKRARSKSSNPFPEKLRLVCIVLPRKPFFCWRWKISTRGNFCLVCTRRKLRERARGAKLFDQMSFAEFQTLWFMSAFARHVFV